jgi:cytochrome c6
MSVKIWMKIAVAATGLLAAGPAFAQNKGEAVYKTNCQSCHGAQGVPNPGIARNLGVKAASDPAVKAHSEAQMIAITANGKEKMPAYKGKLTDAEIKGSVDYFRTWMKK